MMAARERIWIYDTTLRDGQQAQGVDFTAEQKHRIAHALDMLGVDYVEGGWPGANPTDSAFFESPPALERARIAAFGMTHRAGRSVQNDETLAAVLDAETPSVCLVGKAHVYHVKTALGIGLDDNLDAIRASVAHVVARGREALFDAEHFFDGYREDAGYATLCVQTALEAGARWAVLCDTNGGTLPAEIRRVVERVCRDASGASIGIHTHNDAETAVASTLAAVDAGARQIQGTINGIGERCGNANLVSVLPALVFKEPYSSRFESGVGPDGIRNLTQVSRLVDEILNEPPNRRAPYVGGSAFAHKAGLHVSAIIRKPDTYEHIVPDSVGNTRSLPVSRQAGRANLRALLERAGIAIDAKDRRIGPLLDHIKALEDRGFAFDAAEASLILRVREYLGVCEQFFEIERYRVSVERRRGPDGQEVTASEAVVVARVDGERRISASESIDPVDARDRGPINALARALGKDLGRYQGFIAGMRLVDFKVRILSTGTEAVTRVLIDSTDGAGNDWTTVGVSPNIVDASFQALLDSINFRLLSADVGDGGEADQARLRSA